MTWVRIEDRAPEHRKQLAAGPAACWLWLCGLAYANRQPQHDGFIPTAALPLLGCGAKASKEAARLVEVGLWERVEGGWSVHDYHEYQLSPEQLSARAAAGRRGGLQSGEARRRSKHEANGSPNSEANPKQTVHQTAKQTGSNPRTSPDPDPDPDPNLRSREIPPSPRNGKAEPSRDGPLPSLAPTRRLIDPALAITAEQRASAEILGLTNIDGEWTKFVGHHRSKGTLSCDFDGEWAKWSVNARGFQATERAREALRGPGAAPGTNGRPPEPPEAVDARQRARDHEYARLKRDAVPPPTSLAALIANIPGPALRKSPPPLPAIRNELTEDEIEVRRQEQIHAAEEFESVSAKGDGT